MIKFGWIFFAAVHNSSIVLCTDKILTYLIEVQEDSLQEVPEEAIEVSTWMYFSHL